MVKLIPIKAYGKTFKIHPEKHIGYIKCDSMKRVYPISKNANPFKTDKGDSYLCDCGKYTHESPFFHTLVINDKEIKYGDW